MRVAMMFEHSGWLPIEFEQELGKNHHGSSCFFPKLLNSPCLKLLTMYIVNCC